MKKSLSRLSILAAALAVSAAAPAPSTTPAAGSVYFDVRSYGAAGDGKTVDTAAINAAISAAAKAGGGTVYFRAGTYPSYAVHLQSNVAIYLDHGAVLQAAGTGAERVPEADGGPPGSRVAGAATPAPSAENPPATKPAGNLWDAAEPNAWDAYQDYGHSHFHNSFLWGEDLHDISILGPGMIDGRGLVTNADARTLTANKALALKHCRNVTLRDFTFFRGGHFCVLATGVDNFTVDNLKFDTNRDGIDIDSCKNVRVSNCDVNSPADDGICLKSDYALGEARACENVTITNCQVSGYVMGTFLDGTFDRSNLAAPDKDGPTGRIKFGTESNGGFRNITISNCVFDHCRGLAIESVDGGNIEDVTISNLTMRDISNSPIFIRLGDRGRGPKEKTPVAQIKRINISDISVSAVAPQYPVLLVGLPGHLIEDVRLSNLRIAYQGGGTAEWAKNMPPENENTYPEPSKFGILPAAAFYMRHVKNLEMHHIDVTFDKADARPAFVLEDVQGADFQHMQVPRFEGVPYFVMKNVADFSTQYVRSVADMRREKVAGESISK